jgi:hypothetical protein
LWLSELRTSENPAATLLCLALMSIQKRIANRWIEAILLGDAVALVIETIEKHINCFFVQALQLDPKTLRLD